MSTRAKWIACIAAFAVGGLIASIPAFLGRSPTTPITTHEVEKNWDYEWVDDLPKVASGIQIDRKSVPIATAADGSRLLAARWDPNNPATQVQMCFQLSQRGGGGCVSMDRSAAIQLVGRELGGRTTWWGVLAQPVKDVRVRIADGSARILPAGHGFVYTAKGRDRPLSFTALDRSGAAVGTVPADSSVPVECDGDACVISMTFSEDG